MTILNKDDWIFKQTKHFWAVKNQWNGMVEWNTTQMDAKNLVTS